VVFVPLAAIRDPAFVASAIAEALGNDGLLIASGLLIEDLDEIEAALRPAGFSVEARVFDGPWACLRARRVTR